MWRERVYVGTLRSQLPTPELITSLYLDNLLDHLRVSIRRPNPPRVALCDMHDVSKIVEGIYIGDRFAARDKGYLLKHGFTHVLNAAEGPTNNYQVNTGPAYYDDVDIIYYGIPGQDLPSWNIAVYFETAAKFIHSAAESHGKILVHCVAGLSRSATLVLAYFMIYRQMDAAQAMHYVFTKRRIYPNRGFLGGLANLNRELKKAGRLPNSA